MKQKLSLLLAMLFISATSIFAFENPRNGFQQYKLDNGLTVYLWEDHSLPNVHGRVVARAGAVDEPSDYTGLAHYLEHMLFKGTDKIGAIDWEKEKPIYEEIIRLYDEFNKATDPKQKEELIKAINEKSMAAAKYGATDDFANLAESYGGTGLNAFTSYDLTAYFNDFPAGALEKWLEINSERLMHPVFRSFQAELENVFEEYNMYQDDNNTHQRQFMASNAYAGTPYSRDVIGYPEHLKNPSLSALIKFFETWYVPNNMALILVGNFDAEAAKPLIAEKFGRLQPKELPARVDYKDTDLTGGKKYTAKMSDYAPTIMWIYNGSAMGSEDDLLLNFTLALLNNGRSTGLLDKLMLDGSLNAAFAMNDARRYAGRIIVQAVPYFDMAQRTWESNRATEKMVLGEIEKLKNGNIPEWLFNSVKSEMLQQYELMFESAGSKVNMLTYAYAYNEDMEENFNMNKAIEAITIEDVKRCAAKYFGADHITLNIEVGEPKKNKLAKPKIQPLDPPKGIETAYAKAFKAIPTTPVKEEFNDFSEVTKVKLYEGVNMFYTPNTKNNVFSLTLKYGVGTAKMPKLGYAASLLNSAGMMPNVSAQDLRRQFSELGATCSFGADDSYFYISVMGDEQNLQQICQLMTRQSLLPNLDDKQIKSMISNAYFGRMNEKSNPATLKSALLEYMLYGEKSKFIDRIPVEELYKYTIMNDGTFTESFLINKTNLTETIQEATSYAVDIHFCGTTPIKQVAEILKANTPIKEQMKASSSPVFREKMKYDKTAIYFMPDSKVQQADVYFYFSGKEYNINQDVLVDAFNQYFAGGFSGLVMNEIREKRSMAYTADGRFNTPARQGLNSYFMGYVGTQHDKVADAVDVFMELINNMPNHPERIENITNYLYQTSLIAKPSMRSKSSVYDYWQTLGYKEDPAKVNIPKIKALSYDQIESFYKENIQNQPVTIIIIGDPKTINMKQLKAKYGKINRISSNKLFKGGF